MSLNISNPRNIYLNLVTIFFFICGFPWVSFSSNNMDSQPWPLLFGSMILIIDKQKKIPKYLLISLTLTSLGLIFSIYQSILAHSSYLNLSPWILRSIANYSSFFVVLILSWNAFSRGYERLKLINIVKITTFIYYIFAITITAIIITATTSAAHVFHHVHHNVHFHHHILNKVLH